MKSLALVLTLLWCLTALGCKKSLVLEGEGDGDGEVVEGDGEEGDGDGPIQEDLVDAFQMMHEAECSMLFRCCGEGEREVVFGLEGDEEDCRDRFESMVFDMDQAILDASVEAQRVVLDEERVQLCVASFLALACEDWTTLEPARSGHLEGCGDMLLPQVRAGESCYNHFECVTGYCERGMEESGTCQALAGEGEDCFDVACESGYYCDFFNEVCLPAQSNGSPCFNDYECASGFCAQVSDGTLSCQEPLAICGGN